MQASAAMIAQKPGKVSAACDALGSGNIVAHGRFGRQSTNRKAFPMPSYYFNIRRKSGLTKDPAAVELLDVEEARQVALSYAREFLAADIANGEVVRDDVFEICDAHEKVLMSVPFRDALRLHET